ncbi:MAG: sulfatase family protein [Opitutales bacterium]
MNLERLFLHTLVFPFKRILCGTTLGLVALLNLVADERPNFIFFIADDVSQEDLGIYGHPVIQTPHIDALAAEGMRFDNAYLTSSSCSPSRISIVTGRYPHNTGAPELHKQMPADQVPFTRILREHGYYTVLSGKNHMVTPEHEAFDKISKGRGPGGNADWKQEVIDRPRDKPFFFWFSANDAHRKWQITDEVQTYPPEDVVIPPYMFDGPETRDDLASYYHEVSRFDYYVGEVVEELRAQGVLENTFIVVTADNGRPHIRAKGTVYDSGIRAPWIVHYPEIVDTGSVSESLISSIDFSATCLELAGISKPEPIQGISFLPILKAPEATTRDFIFAEQNWHVYAMNLRLVRLGDYTYIHNRRPDILSLTLESGVQYPAGKELWEAHAAGLTNDAQTPMFQLPAPEEMLFDVSKDPHQLINLAENPEYDSKLKQMRALLSEWVEQTGDSVPTNPTPHRRSQPKIENGKLIRPGKVTGPRNPHAEMPGASKGAEQINHRGPVRL